MPKSICPTNLVALDHYIQQLRKVGNKSDQSDIAYQPNKSEQSNDSSTTSTTGSKSTTTCATPSNCIGCAPFSCAKSDSASPYFEPNINGTTAIGRTGEFFGSCGGNTGEFFGSTTQGKNECGGSWNSCITRLNSQTKLSSSQHISSNRFWSVNTKRNLDERPNNDGTINNNTFISNSI
jgi:hypothetical protein